jgi:hypothetical protein
VFFIITIGVPLFIANIYSMKFKMVFSFLFKTKLYNIYIKQALSTYNYNLEK